MTTDVLSAALNHSFKPGNALVFVHAGRRAVADRYQADTSERFGQLSESAYWHQRVVTGPEAGDSARERVRDTRAAAIPRARSRCARAISVGDLGAVGGGRGRAKSIERVGVLAAGARASARLLARRAFSAVGASLQLRELRPNRLRIDVAHQAADELHLSAARFMFGDAASLRDRVGKTLGQRERSQPRRTQVDQRLAKVLQIVHRRLAARFGG